MIRDLIRPHLKDLIPYSSARDELKGEAHIFLDANENPFCLSEDRLERYPDPYQSDLRGALSELFSVDVERIFIGNGSDEAIDLLIRTFCEPQRDSIVICPTTYGMYAVSGKINNVTVKEALLDSDFDLDLGALREICDGSEKICFLCSPGNPTGNLLSEDRILRMLEEFSGLVVVDEAYIDFSESSGLLSALNDFPNVVLLRTLSKAWGLANIRTGILMAHPDIVSMLKKVKPPYNVSGVSQKLAMSRLAQKSLIESKIAIIKRERDRLVDELNTSALVTKVYPTDSNFILVRVEDASFIYDKLLKLGIVVRNRSSLKGLENCIRITVGTPEQNEDLIQALRDLEKEESA